MMQDDEDFARLTESFYAAALDGESWDQALHGLAEATGSRSGQLIGIGSEGQLPFNIVTGMGPELHEALEAARGGDPEVNPRVAAGMQAPVLKVLAENDFISAEEMRRHPHYQEFARPWDVPYICLTNLAREEGLVIGLAVLRGARQGHISDTQRRVFAALAPHVQGAVRTHLALQNQGEALLMGSLERLLVPAFICDRAGQVRALTAGAEALLQNSRLLSLSQGRLQGSCHPETRLVQDAIEGALQGVGPSAPLLRTVVLRGDKQEHPLVLDVVRLPNRAYALSFRPRVLVVARGASIDRRAGLATLQSAFGLTPAEADIALLLREGRPTAAIAARRRVAIGTVRMQIKSLLAKLGAKSQLELVALLRDL